MVSFHSSSSLAVSGSIAARGFSSVMENVPRAGVGEEEELVACVLGFAFPDAIRKILEEEV